MLKSEEVDKLQKLTGDFMCPVTNARHIFEAQFWRNCPYSADGVVFGY
jgi:hypothetical protein